MPSAVNPSKSPDMAVIGGGIVGLWTAYEAARQGRSATLIEKRTIGAGASGGLLGALMPHQPTGWNAKKEFQLDGLLTLETEIAALEEMTGVTTGYRRCGRLMPIGNAEKRRGTISVFNGPEPGIFIFDSPEEENEAVGQWLATQISAGIAR